MGNLIKKVFKILNKIIIIPINKIIVKYRQLLIQLI
jgi:hypothetical protein